jgi:hypothetical protein
MCTLFFKNMTNDLSIFLGEVDFTHITQDTDHSASSSQRITITTSLRGRRRGGGWQHHLSPTQSNSSIQSGSESSSSYAHGYPEYLAPNPSTVVHNVQWVYEWESSKFYSILVSKWQTIVTWTGQTSDDYKVNLIENRCIALMSVNDYHMAHYTYMMHQLVLCNLSLCSRVAVLIYATSSLCVMYNVKCF